jgi:hypothetical protein
MVHCWLSWLCYHGLDLGCFAGGSSCVLFPSHELIAVLNEGPKLRQIDNVR